MVLKCLSRVSCEKYQFESIRVSDRRDWTLKASSPPVCCDTCVSFQCGWPLDFGASNLWICPLIKLSSEGLHTVEHFQRAIATLGPDLEIPVGREILQLGIAADEPLAQICVKAALSCLW